MPKYGSVGISDAVVVGRRQSGQDGNAIVIFATAPARAWRLRPARRRDFRRRPSIASRARADDLIESHGLSAFGDLAYPADFQHFRYVDPNAPKGGSFSQIGPDRQFNQNFLTFNSLNSYILKGDAAQGMELTFATLMVRCGDEPDAMYGLAAEKVRRSADGLTYQFFIRPQAKFHDGSRLTAHDVAFSLNILKDKGHPIISQSLRDFAGAKADDDTSVTVRFAPKRARDVPLFVAGLPIFSRAYYTTKPFDESTLDVPLGSGAYKVGRFEPGRYIEYRARQGLVGRRSAGGARPEQFRHRALRVLSRPRRRLRRLYRRELSVPRGIHLAHLGDALRFPGDQGRQGQDATCCPTTRRRARRAGSSIRGGRNSPTGALREALNDAFDFEWTNKTIMYGSYERTVSVFQNSDMMAKGPPGAEEIALLEPFRGTLPAEVFGEPYLPPVSDGTGQDREQLRHAAQLLKDAGCADRRRQARAAERRTPDDRVPARRGDLRAAPRGAHQKSRTYSASTPRIRLVDPVQYRARRDGFDFDITVDRFGFSATPGDSLRTFFSSQAAALKGSNNLAGIAEPAVDALIDAIIAAQTRPALTTACRALDRVIRAGRYWIPQWYKASHWIAYWDVFGRPAAQPRYFRGIPDTWWYDTGKTAKNLKPG